ncbi:hypothetical protein L0244_09580 [bacterium]|nr:hypothetical protein [bacterium]MCI0613229.1 hypothetical protein [bacterium]
MKEKDYPAESSNQRKQRFVLRYSGQTQPETKDLEYIKNFPGIVVIDDSDRMLLIEASEADASELAKKISGWKLIRESFTPLPDTKPKVKPSTDD